MPGLWLGALGVLAVALAAGYAALTAHATALFEVGAPLLILFGVLSGVHEARCLGVVALFCSACDESSFAGRMHESRLLSLTVTVRRRHA